MSSDVECCSVVGGNKSWLHWDLMDKVVQQIVIQTKEGDPDAAPLEIDVKKVVQQ